MTENGQLNETGLQNQSAQSVTPQISSQPTQAQPRTYTEDEVNRIIGAKKDKAYEKGYETARSEYSQNSYQGNFSPEQLIERAKQEAIAAAKAELEQQQQAMNQQYQQAHRQKVANEFLTKMQSGMKKHEDFEAVVTSLRLDLLPNQLIELANAFENTDDIMYDLGKNPTKVGTILSLMEKTPHLAYAQMQQLSQSIKKNEEAKANQKNVSEPLSQIQPSTIGSDNGPRTIQDWKNQPWLRG